MSPAFREGRVKIENVSSFSSSALTVNRAAVVFFWDAIVKIMEKKVENFHTDFAAPTLSLKTIIIVAVNNGAMT